MTLKITYPQVLQRIQERTLAHEILALEDEARIIEQHISPLRVSLHASNPEVRRRIIGRQSASGAFLWSSVHSYTCDTVSSAAGSISGQRQL